MRISTCPNFFSALLKSSITSSGFLKVDFDEIKGALQEGTKGIAAGHLTGSAPPSSTPTHVGQLYVDTLNLKFNVAVNTTGPSD